MGERDRPVGGRRPARREAECGGTRGLEALDDPDGLQRWPHQPALFVHVPAAYEAVRL